MYVVESILKRFAGSHRFRIANRGRWAVARKKPLVAAEDLEILGCTRRGRRAGGNCLSFATRRWCGKQQHGKTCDSKKCRTNATPHVPCSPFVFPFFSSSHQFRRQTPTRFVQSWGSSSPSKPRSVTPCSFRHQTGVATAAAGTPAPAWSTGGDRLVVWAGGGRLGGRFSEVALTSTRSDERRQPVVDGTGWGGTITPIPTTARQSRSGLVPAETMTAEWPSTTTGNPRY